MKKKRFTETQIFSIFKEFDAGKTIQEISREHGISKATIYNWKAKYGGMELNELRFFTNDGKPVEKTLEVKANTDHQLGQSWARGIYVLHVIRRSILIKYTVIKE